MKEKKSKMLTIESDNKLMSKKTLGEFVRELRKRAGFENIQALATKAGLNRSYISRLESGDETGSMESLAEVAHALGIRPGVLMDVYVNEPPDPNYDPDVMRLASKLNHLPKRFRAQLEGLADTFLEESEQYKNATDIVKGDTKE